MTDAIARIADAVLYDGHVLWPYRCPAPSSRRRWGSGCVLPAAWTRAGHPDDACVMQTHCLVTGPASGTIEVALRFLHVVERRIFLHTPDGPRRVDELTIDGERHQSWEEAVEREVHAPPMTLRRLQAGHRVAIDLAGGEEREQLGAHSEIVRVWQPLTALLTVGAEPLGVDVHRVEVRIANQTAWTGGRRDAALRRALVSTHTILRAADGARHVSMRDPPAELRGAAAACRNIGTWPVLVGDGDGDETLLSSPVVLPDHPQIAVGGAEDPRDGGELVELPGLELALGGAAPAGAGSRGPSTHEIIDSCASLSPDELLALRGRVDDLRPDGSRR